MAESASYTRARVWSGLLRLSHWLMALLVFGLLFTAWLLDMAPTLEAAASDYHLMMGQSLIFVLALRLYLFFFGKGTDHWRDCLTGSFRDIKPMLVFYLTWGAVEMPRWFGHNRLWGPIYLVFYALLVLAVISGLLIDSSVRLAGVHPQDIHAAFSTLILMFILFHLVAVIMHDLKGGQSDISAMIHGDKLFRKESADVGISMQSVSLDQLKSGANESQRDKN